jgi:DNA-binding NtrC family response regulator
MTDILTGKSVLIVDDEADVLEMLTELLSQCVIDSADSFEKAQQCLSGGTYHAAILDIMGVNGYGLLELCRQKDIPVLMLTAHALSADHLVASIKKGACAYIPKDEMVNIDGYLAEVLEGRVDHSPKEVNWWDKLAPVFDRRFGPDWKTKHKEFLKEFTCLKERGDIL